MTRTLADARRWTETGTALFADAAAGLVAADLAAASALPGWSRAHLVAHVAANADALGHLVHWAATGEETPMYASPQERQEGIDRGARLGPAELWAWLRRSADELGRASATLTDEQWSAEVRTAQGRVVPAADVPWLRAREVLVHAVDLGLNARSGARFADLPEDFLAALVTDVCAKRGLDPRDLPDGPLPEVAAWLAGRSHALVDAPVLDRWL